ncbi:hypothetical protein OROMI_018369 [Orobanche minor]
MGDLRRREDLVGDTRNRCGQTLLQTGKMAYLRRKGAMDWDPPQYESQRKHITEVLHFGGEFVDMPNTLYVGDSDYAIGNEISTDDDDKIVEEEVEHEGDEVLESELGGEGENEIAPPKMRLIDEEDEGEISGGIATQQSQITTESWLGLAPTPPPCQFSDPPQQPLVSRPSDSPVVSSLGLLPRHFAYHLRSRSQLEFSGSPVEMSSVSVVSMLPYHSATASAVLTSMLSVAPLGHGWSIEGPTMHQQLQMGNPSLQIRVQMRTPPPSTYGGIFTNRNHITLQPETLRRVFVKDGHKFICLLSQANEPDKNGKKKVGQ